ncbi:Clp protease [Nocardia panacis]|uniref:Clp protease n=1 Tax=Nocardia panacis TaxID=2340916 RepID=A0A3A4KCX2_9NOCA|nr:Clp protease N-terminal domain-containing protein [Nocardia panacis]RJO76531.1 Clp protease [Nocardia panacis]
MFERFSRTARTSIVIAQEETRALRSPRIEVEHVLLGLLAEGDPELLALLEQAGITHDGVVAALQPTVGADNAAAPLGAEDAEALRSIGIDLDAVRESLEATFGADALDRPIPAERGRRGPFGFTPAKYGHIPFSREAKKVVELSLREALARKDGAIESAHLLLGILRAPNATTERLLGGAESIAVLRTRVHALLDDAA